MQRAWRLKALGGRYYAEYTTDNGETWTPTPPGGFASATAAAQLVVDMKRQDEDEGGLTKEEERALIEKFAGRHGELSDDTYNVETRRKELREGWREYLREHGVPETEFTKDDAA